MAFEKRELTGALFGNDHKTSEKHPDVKGYIIFNGVEYELAGWTKTSSRGEFTSLKISEKRERRDADQSITQRAQATIRQPDLILTRPKNTPNKYAEATGANMNDDVPF